jgi:hypothetical protein
MEMSDVIFRGRVGRWTTMRLKNFFFSSVAEICGIATRNMTSAMWNKGASCTSPTSTAGALATSAELESPQCVGTAVGSRSFDKKGGIMGLPSSSRFWRRKYDHKATKARVSQQPLPRVESGKWGMCKLFRFNGICSLLLYFYLQS